MFKREKMDCKKHNLAAFMLETMRQSNPFFFFPILVFCSISAFAADDFDLPDDVQKAEVPASVEDVADIPVNFAPIEATTTGTADLSVKTTATADSLDGFRRHDSGSRNTEETSQDKPATFKEHPIPEELSRPLRVGIFTGVKELYFKYQGETVHVTASRNKVKFEAGGNSTEDISREFNSEEGGCLAVAPDTKTLGKACYPGSILFRNTNGKLDAINSVDVEDYLRGVVPYEIGKLDSSRIEALKAQAVAARTYAYKHFNSRESVGFDVYADTKDQVYKGLESATPLTDAAVKATAGVVMTYGGEFVIAYYHSTCGGITETLATWNRADLPYLKSVPDRRPNGKPWCDESSYTKWERRFADKEIVKLFKANVTEAKATFSSANGKDFKKIKSIKIKDKLKSGRIMTLRIETDKGHFDILTDRTRWLFKKAGTILPSSFFTVKKEGKEWVLTGTGFGHGVGMCQMGVRARAQAGQSYQEILSHYYQGITLEKFDR